MATARVEGRLFEAEEAQVSTETPERPAADRTGSAASSGPRHRCGGATTTRSGSRAGRAGMRSWSETRRAAQPGRHLFGGRGPDAVSFVWWTSSSAQRSRTSSTGTSRVGRGADRPKGPRSEGLVGVLGATVRGAVGSRSCLVRALSAKRDRPRLGRRPILRHFIHRGAGPLGPERSRLGTIA